MILLDSVEILAAVRRSLETHVLPDLRDDFARVQVLSALKALAEVEDRRFVFSVLSPTRDICGYFELEPASRNSTHLRLAVGSHRSFQRRLLGLPLLRGALQHQIEGEVAHISNSMVSLYQTEED